MTFYDLCHSWTLLFPRLPRLMQIRHIDMSDIHWLQRQNLMDRMDEMVGHDMPSTCADVSRVLGTRASLACLFFSRKAFSRLGRFTLPAAPIPYVKDYISRSWYVFYILHQAGLSGRPLSPFHGVKNTGCLDEQRLISNQDIPHFRRLTMMILRRKKSTNDARR